MRNSYWLRQCEGHTESLIVGSGMLIQLGSFEKTKNYVDVCNEAGKLLLLLQMPADQIRKRKRFERNFECQIMDKKSAIRFESDLNQNTVKVYTDGSNLDGRVGAGFYTEYPNNAQKKHFPTWNLQYCVPGRSRSYFRSSKEPAFGKNEQSTYCYAG